MATQPLKIPTPASSSNPIEQYIPGFSGLTSSASSVINDLLSGGSAAGPAQNQAAKFGVSSGMPGSGVANAFGYDLYNKRANESRQRGLDDLLKMVTGYSGSVAPTAGQQMEEGRSLRDLQQRKDEMAAAERTARVNKGIFSDSPSQSARNKWGVVTSGWDPTTNRPSMWSSTTGF